MGEAGLGGVGKERRRKEQRGRRAVGRKALDVCTAFNLLIKHTEPSRGRLTIPPREGVIPSPFSQLLLGEHHLPRQLSMQKELVMWHCPSFLNRNCAARLSEDDAKVYPFRSGPACPGSYQTRAGGSVRVRVSQTPGTAAAS